MGYYVDVTFKGEFDFYYNMEALINYNVARRLGIRTTDLSTLPRSSDAVRRAVKDIKIMGNMRQRGNRDYGMMGSKDANGRFTFLLAKDIEGICATVSEKLAQAVLERAVYYCPKDTGRLARSGRIERINDKECRVLFGDDAIRYAWYVHEFTWNNHAYPTRAKFLTQAIYEVQKIYGG